MSSKIIPILYSIALYKVVEKILFVGNTEGNEKPEERELPFNVKYKLQRNQDLLLKDYAFYESERLNLIKKLGVSDGTKTVVPQEKMDEYRDEMKKVLYIEGEHSFKSLTPEEVDKIKGEVNVTCEEMNLFIAYMVDDGDLVEDLNTDVKGEAVIENNDADEES